MAPTPKATKEKAEDKISETPIELSPFEVTSTQDKGYNVTNAGLALRTNEMMLDIPQSIAVITRDMINDIASDNTSDFVNYNGGSNFFQGDSAMLRGVRVSMYADGVVDYNFDPVMTDSIAVVRGPVGVLYGVGLVGNLGGAILKTTRTPTGKRGGSVMVRGDQYGYTRVEVDYSDVIGHVGDAEFSYRVDLARQDGRYYWKDIENKANIGYVVFQMKRPENVLRVNFTYSDRTAPPNRNFPITPDGVPYRADTSKEGYNPPQTYLNRRDRTIRTNFTQHLGADWNLILRAAWSENHYNQPIVLDNYIDWQTREIMWSSRLNSLAQQLYSGSFDVTGNYKIFGRKARTNFGIAVEDNTNLPNNVTGTDPAFGSLNFNTNGLGRAVNISGVTVTNAAPGTNARYLAMPIDAPGTATIIRQPDTYYNSSAVTGTFHGSRQERVVANGYVQQNLEVWRDRLTLVGSLAEYSHMQESTNRPYVQLASLTSNVTRTEAVIHRYGAVFNITKDLVAYVLDSNSINPQTVRLIDGSFAPPQLGTDKEIGVKANMFDGRFSASASLFNIELTNVAIGQVGLSPITGLSYSALIGKTYQHGVDFTLFFKPVAGLQITLNGYKGTVRNQAGLGQLPNTFEGQWSVYGRYNFQSDALSKWAIGGGANEAHHRWIPAANVILADGKTPPAIDPTIGSTMLMKDGIQTNFFVEYNYNRHWTFKGWVNNLLDVNMAVGAQNGVSLDPYAPRWAQVAVIYKY